MVFLFNPYVQAMTSGAQYLFNELQEIIFYCHVFSDLLKIQILTLFIIRLLIGTRLKSDLMHKPTYIKFIWLYDLSIQARPKYMLDWCAKLTWHRDSGWLEVRGPLMVQGMVSKRVNKMNLFIVSSYSIQIILFITSLLIFIIFE